MTPKGLSPNARATLEKLLAPAVKAGAEAYADNLRENISAGSRSGVQYPGQPRQSSAPSEFPQLQSGELYDSVESRPTAAPLVYQVGFYGQEEKAKALEFGTVNMAERAPLTRTANDPETRIAMLKAAKNSSST